MRLLCHRGMWADPSEKNSLVALMRAIDRGFGVETDIRDRDGRLVISHDPPQSPHVLPLERFLDAYRRAATPPLLALNIKSDGLHDTLRDALRAHGVDNYFVFDMSIPDTMGYVRRGMPVARRLSEYEGGERFPADYRFVWLDAFEHDWYGPPELAGWLESGKRVCVVSPELHGRPHQAAWGILRRLPSHLLRDIHLCTDLFTEALEIFDVDAD